MAEPEVEWVGQERFVVGAHVKSDGQRDLGGHAGAGGVKRQLAHGDAHAVDAQVAQAEDALAVGDNREADILLWPVAHQFLEAAAPIDGKVEAPRPAEDVAEVLACFAHGRRVDERHEVCRVGHQRFVIECFVVVLKRREVDVSLQVAGTLAELEEDAAKLVFLGVDAFGDEAQ